MLPGAYVGREPVLNAGRLATVDHTHIRSQKRGGSAGCPKSCARRRSHAERWCVYWPRATSSERPSACKALQASWVDAKAAAVLSVPRGVVMNRELELALLREVITLRQARAPAAEGQVRTSPVERYVDPGRHAREQAALRDRPLYLAHVGELSEAGAFVRRDVGGQSLLVVRGADLQVRVFANVCRHRGTRLVDEERGCAQRLRCPYHAWTWDLSGGLVAVPGRAEGFPDLDDAAYGLVRVPHAERLGGVWIRPDHGEVDAVLDAVLAPLSEELEALGLDRLVPYRTSARDWHANWKLLSEGGLESYHFAVAHADSIAPFFVHNGATWRRVGHHFRLVIPRVTLDALPSMPEARWHIREHCNVLYLLFPNLWVLVQADHVVLFHAFFDAVDRTHIRLVTLRPDPGRPWTEEEDIYWARNHAISTRALDEDFGLAERIQRGFGTVPGQVLTFARFEGALPAFHDMLAETLS